MLRYIFLIPLLIFSTSLRAQYPTLGPGAEVQILTADPGAELYSAFGHCAFRIVDENMRFDRVYNYGSFDFNTPGFYLKFIRGKLPYFLSAEGLPNFVNQYAREGRAVRVQTLDLKQESVQGVFEFLEENRKEENKFYPYDFFFDNCATRERDVLADVLGEDLDWNPWPADSLGSLRDLLDLYLGERPWEDFGIDLVLGLPADAEADQQLSMFLPDFLYLAVEKARVRKDGAWKPLVKEAAFMVRPEEAQEMKSGAFTPKLVFWSLFGFVLLFSIFVDAAHPAARVFDLLFFFIIGLLGLVMLGFWLGTNHQATYFNLNILWALPSHLLFAFFRLGRNTGRQYNYARWSLFGLAVLAIAYLFFPQPYHAATLPILLAIGTRMIAVAKGSIDE